MIKDIPNCRVQFKELHNGSKTHEGSIVLYNGWVRIEDEYIPREKISKINILEKEEMT